MIEVDTGSCCRGAASQQQRILETQFDSKLICRIQCYFDKQSLNNNFWWLSIQSLDDSSDLTEVLRGGTDNQRVTVDVRCYKNLLTNAFNIADQVFRTVLKSLLLLQKVQQCFSHKIRWSISQLKDRCLQLSCVVVVQTQKDCFHNTQ